MTARRGILALLLAVSLTALTACAGFATSGPVQYGHSAEDATNDPQNFAFLPNSPQPGATPEQIVEGFISAGTGPGVDGNWARAREFLAPSVRHEWNPNASVNIDTFAERAFTDNGDGTVDFTFEAVATVDDTGAYERAELGPRELVFRLAEQTDGEWRITEAPDGVVLDRDQFPTVFHRYAVMYFDPAWEYLVPDVRWFPITNAIPRVTEALVDQPVAEWLAASVVTAFPDNVLEEQISRPSPGVVQVELSEEALAVDRAGLDRMLTQLEESLAAAGVGDVVLSVGSTPLEAQAVPVRSTRVPGAPLVLTEQGFGFLTGDEVEPLPGLSQAITETTPLAVQIGPDRELATARLASGEVVRLGADGGEPEVLDTRSGLIDPTIDPSGIVWSVPTDSPVALRAYLPSGDAVDVADAWSEATAISAMALSRDGTRMAATVTAGGRTALWVAGVIRNAEGVPQGLGPAVQRAVIGGPATGLTWIDDMTVGVLTSTDEQAIVVEQVVGGPTVSTTTSTAMASIAGGNGAASLRLRGADGTLYVKRGSTWQPTATGILVLATQQGAPQ